jgi:hypothetical protein
MKDTCRNHLVSEGNLVDLSTTGSGYESVDASGKRISHHEIDCGDKGYFKHYTNSLGYKYAEECVSCAHRNLCFQYLELAGDITRPGQLIFGRCADITADPERMQKELDDIIAAWRKQIERAQNSSSAHAEGWKG